MISDCHSPRGRQIRSIRETTSVETTSIKSLVLLLNGGLCRFHKRLLQIERQLKPKFQRKWYNSNAIGLLKHMVVFYDTSWNNKLNFTNNANYYLCLSDGAIWRIIKHRYALR